MKKNKIIISLIVVVLVSSLLFSGAVGSPSSDRKPLSHQEIISAINGLCDEVFGLVVSVEEVVISIGILDTRMSSTEIEVEETSSMFSLLEDKTTDLEDRIVALEFETVDLGEEIDELEGENTELRNEIASIKDRLDIIEGVELPPYWE